MSIFTSTSAAVCSVLDTVTDIGTATGKTVSMATTYVDNRATSQQLTDKQHVMLRTAKSLRIVQEELKEDEELTALFNQLKDEFK